jgi:hypothetical protein
MAVAAVPVMHKHVHQRAQQDEQKGESPKQVRTVLGEEEEAEHYSECQPDPGKHGSLPDWPDLVAAAVTDGRHGSILVAWPRARAKAGGAQITRQ